MSGGLFHKRCHCNDVTEMKDCKTLCLQDTNCKGYVMYDSNPDKCQLATTSARCLENCQGPYDNDTVHGLDPHAECGTDGYWNGGCFIKKG